MKKHIVKLSAILSIAMLTACTNFASDGDYSDAVADVRERANFVEVKGKLLSLQDTAGKENTMLRSEVGMTLIFPQNSMSTPSDSYVSMNITYFKTYNEYVQVRYAGKSMDLTEDRVPSETCSEHCTTTQYVSFPVDMATLETAKVSGLAYQISSKNGVQNSSYQIPAAYIQALFNEYQRVQQTTTPAVVAPVAVATVGATSNASTAIATTSKPLEMVDYWYGQASDAQKAAFANWAFQNRKSVTGSLSGTDRASEMLDYWYKEASNEERAAILTWLLEQE